MCQSLGSTFLPPPASCSPSSALPFLNGSRGFRFQGGVDWSRKIGLGLDNLGNLVWV